MSEIIGLKKKYRSGNGVTFNEFTKEKDIVRWCRGGQYTSRTGKSAKSTGKRALMEHPMAIKLHYEECMAKGYLEQVPKHLHASLKPVQAG